MDRLFINWTAAETVLQTKLYHLLGTLKLESEYSELKGPTTLILN